VVWDSGATRGLERHYKWRDQREKEKEIPLFAFMLTLYFYVNTKKERFMMK